MTHSDWLASTVPWKLLEYVKQVMSLRRLRLLGCGAWRYVQSVSDPPLEYRAGLELAELCADGADPPKRSEFSNDVYDLTDALLYTNETLKLAGRIAAYFSVCSKLLEPLSDVVRCVCGDPFTKVVVPVQEPSELQLAEQLLEYVTLNRAERRIVQALVDSLRAKCTFPWRTPDVVACAEAAYESRCERDRLDVLCDALTDAEFPESSWVYTHLRQRTVHVRGCFALDTVLEKL